MPRKIDDEARTKVKHLRAQGLTYKEISVLVGVSSGTVRRWADDDAHRKAIEGNKLRRENNLEKYREMSRSWGRNNKDKKRERNKIWVNNNKHKVREYERKYKRTHPETIAAKYARKRAARNQSIPLWTTPSMKKTIKIFYAMAQNMSDISGVQHDVDHVWPLRGKNSCGLHVPWNLQVVPCFVNQAKRNYEPHES